jgi:hypothetical protein
VVIEASNATNAEAKLHDEYYKIPFRLRSGQEECVAYLSAKKFAGVVSGEPNFKPVAEEKR